MMDGKDDEKIMGPMFPRLHVNDTEKGGPRAPPRNKMALYEQFSIASHRFNSGALPHNRSHPTNEVPAASSSRVSDHERGIFYSLNQCQSANPAEKSSAVYPDFTPPLTQCEQKTKSDEEDFRVPIYVQSVNGQDPSRKHDGADRENNSPQNPLYLSTSVNILNGGHEELKKTNHTVTNLRHKGRSQNEEKGKKILADREKSVTAIQNTLPGEKTETISQTTLKKVNAPPHQQHGDIINFNRLQNGDASLQPESRSRSLKDHALHRTVSSGPTRCMDNGHSFTSRRDPCLGEHPDAPVDGIGCHEDNTGKSLEMRNRDRSDDLSETSMVDSMSGLDISPDDVVGVIGQKCFWKARRAIVNQQRVFAVQVFELHRLIKVQRLIAASPHLLVEEGAYLGQALKGSSAKRHSLEYIAKPSPHNVKQKDDSEDPSSKMECSAENAAGKASLSSVQNPSQLPNYGSFSGNQLPAPTVANSVMNPWSPHQPSGHQWLIPKMSPSEGLVYKPYPGPGFTIPFCGSCGQTQSTPLMGNIMNPVCGIPAAHHHYQGIGVPPTGSTSSNCYFPPYGMPVMNPVISGSSVEQTNQFSEVSSHGKLRQLSGGRAKSCNGPIQKDTAISCVVKPRASKESQLQGSIATSPGERGQGTGMEHRVGGANALPLFPTPPTIGVPNGAPQAHITDQTVRVIRVVPHNARTASESAARIFRSIQEERKHNDSV